MKMNRPVRLLAPALLACCVSTALANDTPQALPFGQDWSNTGLITANDDWSGVPGIVGYLGQDLVTSTGADPQGITAASTAANDVDVIANIANPSTTSNGGVGELETADPVIGLQGSGTADAPHIVVNVNTTGRTAINVAYNVRDMDASADNAIQAVALQYRVGNTGPFINIPAGFVPDATLQGSATLVTPVSAQLPADADNQPLVQVRMITSNAAGNDEWVGIDDIAITGTGGGGGTPVATIANQSVAEGDSGTTPMVFTVSLSGAAGAGGVEVDFATADGSATAGDDYIAATGTVVIPEGATSATVTVNVIGDTAIEQDETFTVALTAARGADLGTAATATGTITNDDVLTAPIHLIQGNGATSPFAGQVVRTTGVVTGRKSNGFFFQTPDGAIDSDPATSQALFVFTSAAGLPATATVGTLVEVTGTVAEYIPAADPAQLPLTQLTNSTTTVVAVEQPLPAPIVLTAADFASTALDSLERYENMRVAMPGAVVVAPTRGNINENNSTATSNGLFAVSAPGIDRPLREPGIRVPDALPSDNTATAIPRFDFNSETVAVDSDVLGFARVDVAVGCVFDDGSLVGPLDYTFRRYTISPERDITANCDAVAPRAVPLPTPDEATFGAYNLQRFFDTVNDAGIDDPTLTPAALEIRMRKASEGIRDYLNMPDVLAVTEVENIGILEALATRINADAVTSGEANPGYVARLIEGFDVGGIDVGFLVRTGEVAAGTPRVRIQSVQQVGASAVLTNPDNTTTVLNDRPPLVLDAVVEFADGRSLPVTAIAVHQRSLNDMESEEAGSNGWATVGARVRAKRQAQAIDLATNIQAMQSANADRRIVVLGDFNAFQFNDGYVDVMGASTGVPADDNTTAIGGDGTSPLDPMLLNTTFLAPPEERYSFVFDYNGQAIDHILVNSALAGADDVVGIALGHARINADFPETARGDATVTRLSDHDPAVLRVQLEPVQFADLAVAVTADDASVPVGGEMAWTATIDNLGPDAAEFPGVGFVVNETIEDFAVTAPAGWTCDPAEFGKGSSLVTCAADTLADAAQAGFAVTGTAPAWTGGETVELSVAATSQTEDPVDTNDSADAGIAIGALADMSVSIGGPDVFLRNTTVEHLVTVANLGPSGASGLVLDLAVDLPATSVNIVAPAMWTCVANAGRRWSVTCELQGTPTVPADMQFVVQVSTAGRPAPLAYAVSAGISSDIEDPAPANNVDLHQATLVRQLP